MSGMKRRRSGSYRPAASKRPLLRFERLETRELLATFTVTNTGDSGSGSLRDAINQANGTAEPDVIEFDIAPGVQTITLATALPDITEPLRITGLEVGGAVAPGRSPNTAARFDNAVLTIVINGGGNTGFFVDAPNSSIEGLVLQNFLGAAVNSLANNVTISGNYIGLAPDGTMDATTQNTGDGIIVSGAGGNVIGGPSPLGPFAGRNVIANNTGVGVRLSNATGSAVQGNFIGADLAGGTNPDPQVVYGNGGDGIRLEGGSGHLIGGALAPVVSVVGDSANPAANLVMGHATAGTSGIHLLGGAVANSIQGNTIGVDGQGVLARANNIGVAIDDSPANVVGGAAANSGNVIAGSLAQGVAIVQTLGNDASANSIQGNTIGTTPITGASTGENFTSFLGNSVGVEVTEAPGANIVGNRISANRGAGVRLTNSGAATIDANTIGGALGSGLGNNAQGVLLAGSTNALITGNTVRGNTNSAVRLESTSSGATISGNTIDDGAGAGVDIDDSDSAFVVGNAIGTLDSPNLGDGIRIVDSSNVTVGGAATGQGNSIVGNRQNGLQASTATGLAIIGNTIDGNVSSGVALSSNSDNASVLSNTVSGNGSFGILIDTGADALIRSNVVGGANAAQGNGGFGVRLLNAVRATVGGSAAGEGNTISGNHLGGLEVENSGAASVLGNSITGNLAVGVSIDGSTTATLATNTVSGNLGDGVAILAGSNSASLTGNTIQSNLGSGVSVDGATGAGLFANSIGGATPAEGNRGHGVSLNNAAGATIGSATAGQGNTIRNNLGAGVSITSSANGSIVGNTIADNRNDGVSADAANNLVVGPANAVTGNAGAGLRYRNSTGVQATGNTVTGNLGAGVIFDTSAGQILSNTIGTNGGDGVLTTNAGATTIGGAAAAAGNSITGNQGFGVRILAGTAAHSVGFNTISGNRGTGVSITQTANSVVNANTITTNLGNGVTLDRSDNAAVTRNTIGTNAGDGVAVLTSTNATIGGASGAGNSITGNQGFGVRLVASPNATVEGNTITGNLGTGVALSAASNSGAVRTNTIRGNLGSGVAINASNSVGVQGNTIGGANAGERNEGAGVQVVGSTGATIGATGSGNTIVGNGGDGVLFSASTGQIDANTITANLGAGVRLTNASNNVPVRSNSIGSNLGVGVAVIASTGATIGGTGAANTIQGNVGGGLLLSNAGNSTVATNTVSNNQGTGVAIDGGDGVVVRGVTIDGNVGDGLALTNASNASIGGTGAGQSNIIGNNRGVGARLSNLTGATSFVGNSVGANLAGGVAAANVVGLRVSSNTIGGNGGDGLSVSNSANAVLGGDNAADGNRITDNQGNGVVVSASANARLSRATVLSNHAAGVVISASAASTITGATIGSNDGDGVVIRGSANAVLMNAEVLNNGANGVVVQQSNDALLADNLIGANKGDGVHVLGSTGFKSRQGDVFGNLGNGVTVESSSTADIRGGTFESNTGAGIFALGGWDGSSPADPNFDNLVLVGSNVRNNAGDGLSLQGLTRVDLFSTNFDENKGAGVRSNRVLSFNADQLNVRNNAAGVAISASPSPTLLGSTIAGNRADGVLLDPSGSPTITGNTVHSNLGNGLTVLNASGSGRISNNVIGLLSAGGANAGNTRLGIFVADAGPGSLQILSNTISANVAGGVQVTAGAGIQISNNRIGTNAVNATSSQPFGIFIDGSPSNRISGNDVSGHDGPTTTFPDKSRGAGIVLNGSGAIGNVLVGNLIGSSAPNLVGVYIVEASANLVGGLTAGEPNRIQGNLRNGVLVFGPSARGNAIVGNDINAQANGAYPNGAAAPGPDQSGVLVMSAPGTVIDRNTMENNRVGVHLYGLSTDSSTPTVTSNSVTIGDQNFAIDPNDIITERNTGRRTIAVVGQLGAKVTNNILAGNLFGVFVGGALGNTISGNTITNDHQGFPTSPVNLLIADTSTGIQVLGANSSFNAVMGNTIVGPKIGVYVEQASSNNVNGNRISNTGAVQGDYKGAESYLNRGDGAGIYLFGNRSTRNRVFGNVVTGVRGYGILFFNTPKSTGANQLGQNTATGSTQFNFNTGAVGAVVRPSYPPNAPVNPQAVPSPVSIRSKKIVAAPKPKAKAVSPFQARHALIRSVRSR